MSEIALWVPLAAAIAIMYWVLFSKASDDFPRCKKCYKAVHYVNVADHQTQCRTGLCRKCFSETPAQHLVLKYQASFDSSEAICPFCGHEFDPNVYGFVSDRRYVTDCEHCGCTFYLEVTNIVKYDTYSINADPYADD
jgi:transcription elongation factor Elf1